MNAKVDECDWCGRVGRTRDYASWDEGVLHFANPTLCDVCWLLLAAPGEVEDVWAELPSARAALDQFEDVLAARAQHRNGGH